MFFQKLITEIKENPVEVFLGVSVVALMMFGTSLKDVASTVLALFILFALSKLRHFKESWYLLSNIEKVMFVAFTIYTISGFLSFINVDDTREYVKQMDRYLRFMFIVPVVLAVIYSRFNFEKYFYTGVVLSGPAYLYFAIESIMVRPEWPAGGAYHHITFGDAAALNALLMLLVLVLEPWKARWKILVMLSMFCSLYAAILSQARGAWIAIPIGVLIMIFAGIDQKKFKVIHAVMVFSVLVAGVVFTPAGKILESRYIEAVDEVNLFFEHGDATTSNGGRLALWDMSIRVWKSSPLLGTGPGDFDNDLQVYQNNNVYKDMDVHSSVHNIYFQALVSTGLFGFLVLLVSLVVLPLWYFANCISRGVSFGYYGVMLISAYAVFGLTESWILRAPVVSTYIIYFIVILLICRHRESQV